MRRESVIGTNIVGLFDRAKRVEVQEPGAVRAYAGTDGPSAAAWLVFKYRRTIHRTGQLRLHIDRDKGEIPMWMRVAIEHLRTRSGWTVTIAERRATRFYTITYERWGTWQRAS